MSTVERRLLAREAAISAAVAATLTGLIVWLGPPGVDLAAHSYQRTFLLEHGFALWNNFWYGGRYSFVTYSFLYYPLAALIGIKILAVATISAAALAFTLVVWQEWGPAARFSSRTFAVLWAGVALSAAFPFALGAALALLAVNALQRGRRRSFAGLVFLTLLASPLAFLLLALILAGSALERRPRRETVAVVAAAGALELVLRRVFPGEGKFPFSVADFVPGVAFAVLGILVTVRVPRARRLLGLFAVFLAAILFAFVIPSDLGSNVERLKFAAIPIALLAAGLAAPKRILLAIALVAVAGFWNISALAHTAKSAAADPAHKTAYWTPAIRYLHQHLSPVVPGRGGRHRRALGGRLPPRCRHPDRARLVSPERLPAERAALRQGARRACVRGLAAEPGRSLRAVARRAARLQRAQRGGAHPFGQDVARARLPLGRTSSSTSCRGRRR